MSAAHVKINDHNTSLQVCKTNNSEDRLKSGTSMATTSIGCSQSKYEYDGVIDPHQNKA